MSRLNPADVDYQINAKILQRLAELEARVGVVQANSHMEAGPIDGSTESIVQDPDNPQIFIYTSDLVDPAAHVIDVPFSSLMVPDPSNPHIFLLPHIPLP